MPKKQPKSFWLLLIVLLLICSALIVTAGVAYRHSQANGSSDGQSATSLTIKRMGHRKGVNYFTLRTSQATAATLLQDVKNFKPSPAGVMHCPIDSVNGGVTYELLFTKPKLDVSADSEGCRGATYNGNDYDTTDKFWMDLAAAIGEPVDPGGP